MQNKSTWNATSALTNFCEICNMYINFTNFFSSNKQKVSNCYPQRLCHWRLYSRSNAGTQGRRRGYHCCRRYVELSRVFLKNLCVFSRVFLIRRKSSANSSSYFLPKMSYEPLGLTAKNCIMKCFYIYFGTSLHVALFQNLSQT